MHEDSRGSIKIEETSEGGARRCRAWYEQKPELSGFGSTDEYAVLALLSETGPAPEDCSDLGKVTAWNEGLVNARRLLGNDPAIRFEQ